MTSPIDFMCAGCLLVQHVSIVFTEEKEPEKKLFKVLVFFKRVVEGEEVGKREVERNERRIAASPRVHIYSNRECWKLLILIQSRRDKRRRWEKFPFHF